MAQEEVPARKRVVILGAGTAGVSLALGLKNKRGIEVTLVDQKNYHTVIPLIYQVVTGSVTPANISFPVRKLLRQRSEANAVRFRQEVVQGVDANKRTVITDQGTIEWDYLVVAMGAVSNFFGMSDVEEVALTFRSLTDAVNLHNHILESFEAASSTEDELRRRELLTFAIVGGGPSGVELSAHIREFIDRALARDYRGLAPLARVILIEAQDNVLGGMKPAARELARSRLRARGIEFMLNTRIARAAPGSIETADGRTIPTRNLIWCSGVKPAPAVQALPFPKAKDGRILVDEHLQVQGLTGVYAMGDCAYLEQQKGLGPYPPTFQVAFRQGRTCAGNILNAMKGRPRHAYRHSFLGQIFYVDRNTAVAQLFGQVFDGFLAGMMRRGLFVSMLIAYGGPLTGLKSKLSAALDWTFAYFYVRNISAMRE
ncbi:MAG: NAD(P)/FAD-dependent oxidoreductase [Dehalococcoidia bacterium]|nr:NAD(P)/FAD-dependent oxidoreductase [Dehalococcoidia bacterium]